MTRVLREWLRRRWSREQATDLARSYHAAFSTLDGQRVLAHLLDNVYFKVYEGCDPSTALVHNARRSVIQDILENIDIGEFPSKYNVPVQVEENGHAPR